MGPAKSPIQPPEARRELCRGAWVFNDPLARIFPDEEHSTEEPSEIIVGHSAAKHLLLVCFTEPAAGRIRIISARRATRLEQYDYEEHVTS